MYLQYLGVVIVAGLLVTQCAAAPEGRIVNGHIAVNYQFPWHVSLIVTVANSSSPRYCGGSLISSRYILTAATCVLNAQSIRADLGSINFSTPLQTQVTIDYVIHPQFSTNYNVNNIAVIRLNTDVWYTNEKRAILLAGQSKVNTTFVNTASYIFGFGVFQNGSNYMSESLRYAYTTVITNAQCEQMFPPLYIRAETMCTTGYTLVTQSGCHGDTGGALITNIGGTWYQIGLVSTIHGAGCSGAYPNLHTRITPYLQWIYQMTGKMYFYLSEYFLCALL